MQHRQPLPYPLELFTGAIGKQFVVKRTPWGKIITRYPDMSRIIASAGQRRCRNLFKEAVAYAKAVIADKAQNAAWQKRLNKTRGIYNAAISFYMKKEKLAKAREEQLTARLIRQAVSMQPAFAPSAAITIHTGMISGFYESHTNNAHFQNCIRAGDSEFHHLTSRH